MQNLVRRAIALVLPFLLCALLPPQSIQQEIDQFKSDFRKAMGLKDAEEMARLVSRHSNAATEVVVQTCNAIAIQTSERLELDIEGLRKAWRKAKNDARFVDNMYEYVSLMRPSIKEHRYKLISEWSATNTAYWKAVREEDVYRFPGLGLEFNGLAETFEKINDHYYASEAYLFAALCYEDQQVGTDNADLRRAYQLFGKYLTAREKVDLKDTTYNTNKQRWEALGLAGFGPESAAAPSAEEGAGDSSGPGADRGGRGKPKGGAGAGPGAPRATGPVAGPVSATMTFEVMRDPYELERPSYHGDELFAMWNSVALGERGTSGVFFTMNDSPKVVRDGISQLSVDTDGNGEGDVEIPVTGSIELIEIEIGSGEARRPWAFFSGVPDDRRIYQGISVNQSPQPAGMSMFVGNAATVRGDLAGVSVRVIDDNMDGIYGSLPIGWQFFGLREGNSQPQLDSIVIGGGKRAIPWSQYQKLGDQWYRLEAEQGGMKLTAKPEEIKTGRLALKTKGPKPDYLVVRGSGKWENCYFDLTEGGSKGVEVPAGAYSVYVGKISKGKRMQTLKALILPGDSEPVTVEADGAATLTLGAPFLFDFDYSVEGETVKVLGKSVIVRGSSGEVYDRVWNAVHRPEVSLRKAGARKGGKGKKMTIIQEQQQMSGMEGSWSVLWRPLDIVLETGKVAPDFEVNLFEKKNKLFGTIESNWK